MFSASAGGGRERELITAMSGDELARAMLGNVKVVAGAAAQQATRAIKQERKAAATAASAKRC